MILKLFYGVNEQLKKACNKVHKFTTLCAQRLFSKHYTIEKIYYKLFLIFYCCCSFLAVKVFTLGLLQLHIAFVASKAVVDQQTAESQVSSSHLAQQRVDYGYGAPDEAAATAPDAGYNYPPPASVSPEQAALGYDNQAPVAQVASTQAGYDYAAAIAPAAPLQAGFDYAASAAPLIDDHHHHDHLDHHHHHDEHDPGFWKKKVTWKEGWKKYWVRFLESSNILIYNFNINIRRNQERNRFGNLT